MGLLLPGIVTSEPNVLQHSSPGDLCRRFAKFIENISQRHNKYVSLGMLCGLKIRFTRVSTISYLLEEIQIDLPVTFRDQHYRFGVG